MNTASFARDTTKRREKGSITVAFRRTKANNHNVTGATLRACTVLASVTWLRLGWADPSRLVYPRRSVVRLAAPRSCSLSAGPRGAAGECPRAVLPTAARNNLLAGRGGALAGGALPRLARLALPRTGPAELKLRCGMRRVLARAPPPARPLSPAAATSGPCHRLPLPKAEKKINEQKNTCVSHCRKAPYQTL